MISYNLYNSPSRTAASTNPIVFYQNFVPCFIPNNPSTSSSICSSYHPPNRLFRQPLTNSLSTISNNTTRITSNQVSTTTVCVQNHNPDQPSSTTASSSNNSLNKYRHNNQHYNKYYLYHRDNNKILDQAQNISYLIPSNSNSNCQPTVLPTYNNDIRKGDYSAFGNGKLPSANKSYNIINKQLFHHDFPSQEGYNHLRNPPSQNNIGFKYHHRTTNSSFISSSLSSKDELSLSQVNLHQYNNHRKQQSIEKTNDFIRLSRNQTLDNIIDDYRNIQNIHHYSNYDQFEPFQSDLFSEEETSLDNGYCRFQNIKRNKDKDYCWREKNNIDDEDDLDIINGMQEEIIVFSVILDWIKKRAYHLNGNTLHFVIAMLIWLLSLYWNLSK